MTELLDAAFAVLRSDAKAAALLLVLPQCILSAFDGFIEGLSVAVQLAVGIAGNAFLSFPAFVILLLWAGRLLGERPSWSRAVRGALRRAPAVLLATTVSISLFFLGLFLFFLPAIWVVLVLFLPAEVLAFERVGGLRALARSRALMVGSKRRVVLPVLVLVVLSFLSDLPFGAGYRAAAAFVGAVAGAYLSALSFVTYVDARARKEGFDLEVLAARVAARTDPAEDPTPAGRRAPGPGDAP
jgi:hypothetical protein